MSTTDEIIKSLPGAVTADLIRAMSHRNDDVRAFAFAIAEARVAKGVRKVNHEALTRAIAAAEAGKSIPQRATTVKAVRKAQRGAQSKRATATPADLADEALASGEVEWAEDGALVPA